MSKLKSIMLVDDDMPTNYLHKMVLKKANVTEEIILKSTGLEALEYLTTKNEAGVYPEPDLIFLDINMPKMNGWEFLEAYNKLEEAQRGKFIVVMLTTSLNPEDKQKAENMNEISDFINKPLSIANLQTVLEKYFPGRFNLES